MKNQTQMDNIKFHPGGNGSENFDQTYPVQNGNEFQPLLIKKKGNDSSAFHTMWLGKYLPYYMTSLLTKPQSSIIICWLQDRTNLLFQSADGSRNERMGCVRRPSAQVGQRLHGQPEMPADNRQDAQSGRLPLHIRHRSGLWGHCQGDHAIHDVTAT